MDQMSLAPAMQARADQLATAFPGGVLDGNSFAAGDARAEIAHRGVVTATGHAGTFIAGRMWEDGAVKVLRFALGEETPPSMPPTPGGACGLCGESLVHRRKLCRCGCRAVKRGLSPHQERRMGQLLEVFPGGVVDESTGSFSADGTVAKVSGPGLVTAVGPAGTFVAGRTWGDGAVEVVRFALGEKEPPRMLPIAREARVSGGQGMMETRTRYRCALCGWSKVEVPPSTCRCGCRQVAAPTVDRIEFPGEAHVAGLRHSTVNRPEVSHVLPQTQAGRAAAELLADSLRHEGRRVAWHDRTIEEGGWGLGIIILMVQAPAREGGQ